MNFVFVPGLQSADIHRLRSKSGMAEVFHAAGVPHPELIRVRDAVQVKELAAKVGYPLVLKPDVGVGAAHTFMEASPQAKRLHLILEDTQIQEARAALRLLLHSGRERARQRSTP